MKIRKTFDAVSKTCTNFGLQNQITNKGRDIFVAKRLTGRVNNESVDFLSSSSKEYASKNATFRNPGKYSDTDKWTHNDSLSTTSSEQVEIRKLTENIVNRFNSVWRQNDFSICLAQNYGDKKTRLKMNYLNYTQQIKLPNYAFLNHFVKVNPNAYNNTVLILQRFYSRCGCKQPQRPSCRPSCKPPINPKLADYQKNKDKCDKICKYCGIKRKKRKGGFFEWICIQVGCRRKESTRLMKITKYQKCNSFKVNCCKMKCPEIVKETTEPKKEIKPKESKPLLPPSECEEDSFMERIRKAFNILKGSSKK